MKLRAALLALLAAPALLAQEPAVEFSGLLTVDGQTRIALTDRSNNSTTWVQPGETIAGGYLVDRYDARQDAIFLKKNGQEIRLGLIPAKTPETPLPRAALSGTPSRSASSATAVTPPVPAPATPPVAANAPSLSAAPASPAAATTTPIPSPLPAPPTPSATPGTAAPVPQPNSSTTASSVASASTPTATSSPSTNTPTPEPSLPPTGRQPSTPTHLVQGGDTLDSIALVHGVTVQQIRELNPTLNSTSLRAGDTIRVR